MTDPAPTDPPPGEPPWRDPGGTDPGGSAPAAEHVRAVARLAHLELSAAEVEEGVPTLGRLLGAFRVLAGADVEGLEPLFTPGDAPDEAGPSPAAEGTPPAAERAAPGATPRELLENAPERSGRRFSVPRTVPGVSSGSESGP